MSQSKLAYSIADVMLAADAGRSSIYRAIAAGDLRAVKRGRRTLVLADDLRAWLQALRPVKHTAGGSSGHAADEPGTRG